VKRKRLPKTYVVLGYVVERRDTCGDCMTMYHCKDRRPVVRPMLVCHRGAGREVWELSVSGSEYMSSPFLTVHGGSPEECSQAAEIALRDFARAAIACADRSADIRTASRGAA